jgi:hypothetical protein
MIPKQAAIRMDGGRALSTRQTPFAPIFQLILILIVWLPGWSATRRQVDSPRIESVNASNNTSMTTPDETTNAGEAFVTFYEALSKALKKRRLDLQTVCPPGDPVARRVLEDYGAMFVASEKVTPPPVCIFNSEVEVRRFQSEIGFATETIGNAEIELQPEAMKELLKARAEANKQGLDITPRDGSEAGRRNYRDSVRLWNSRFLPALDHWVKRGKLTAAQAARLRRLPLHAQVAGVLELEKSKIFFSKDLSKSILYSIAAPGTSQHIAMLAFDVNEFQNSRVRKILAKHGWFQTVLSDLPHFTFLGLKENALPEHGLWSTVVGGQTFWIPNVGSRP